MRNGNEALLAQLFKLHLWCVSQRMPSGNRQQQWLTEQRMQHHAFMLAQHRQTQQADIQASISNILQLRLRRLLGNFQRNPGLSRK